MPEALYQRDAVLFKISSRKTHFPPCSLLPTQTFWSVSQYADPTRHERRYLIYCGFNIHRVIYWYVSFFFKCQDKISLSRVKTNLVVDWLSVSQTMDSYANRQEKQLISLAQFDTFFVKSGRKRVFSSDRHDMTVWVSFVHSHLFWIIAWKTKLQLLQGIIHSLRNHKVLLLHWI